MRPPVLNHSLSRRPSRDWDWSDRMQQLKRYSPLLVGISLLILFSGAWSSSSGSNGISPNGGHIVVIDAGSSGSRAHVFAYNGQGVVNPAHESLKTKPGLSSYSKTPDQAGASLEPLLKFAREHISADEIARTKIVLKATAGMRLLDKADQKAVMRNVQDFLKKSDFQYGVAEVIDGKEEGLLGWMAVNYLNNQQNAGNGSSGNWGVLEMGGASVQYTVPLGNNNNKIAKEHQRFYRDPTSGAPGQVFTHSFIGLGMQSARQAVNQALQSKGAATDPCLYTHYIEEHDTNEFSGVAAIPPAGDFQQCVAMIEQTLFATQASCTNCLFNGIVAPDKANIPLWAFENFYYTTSGLGVFTGGTGRIQISDIVTAGQSICATDWSEVDTTYPKDGQDKTDNEKWCFGAAYLSTFLTKGLGLSPQQELTVGNSVGDNGIDWALGAAVLEASGNKKKKGMLRSS